MWTPDPPPVDLCGNPYPEDAQPLPVVQQRRLRRWLSPVRFQFAGCREGTPLVKVRFAWWHPVSWSRIARHAFLRAVAADVVRR